MILVFSLFLLFYYNYLFKSVFHRNALSLLPGIKIICWKS